MGWEGDLVHVTRLEQALEMREIRNACRLFMTENPREISIDEQIAWFERIKDDPKWAPFLLLPRRRLDALGYGLVRQLDSGKWVVSGGLMPKYRGLGLGVQLFWELADYIHEAFKVPAWLTVWSDNERAWRTYLKVGFVFASDTPPWSPSARVKLDMRKDLP